MSQEVALNNEDVSLRVSVSTDPIAPDWASITLPDAWPDHLNFLNPRDWFRALKPVLGTPRRAEIPHDLPGRERLPKYLIQEFHGLPNGNFSKRITRGYITGFDRIMLGQMRKAREHIAETLRGCNSVLDVGCGGGQTGALLKERGITEVWGIDPSPYLLQHAARAYPQVRFVQGLAEDLHFPAARFDGVVACFVLHEMPPKVAERALREFHRVLKTGGRLTICEPSAVQLNLPWRALFRRYGWRGLYFRWLANRVHEPYVASWHKQNLVAHLDAVGFRVSADEQEMPVRHVVATKR